MGLRGRVNSVTLEQPGRVVTVGHALEQERYQGGVVRTGDLREQPGELFAVRGAIVRRYLHADQHDLGARALCCLGHLVKVVLGSLQGKAAQGVIAAKFDDQVARAVLRQHGAQAGAPAGGGVAADAGVDDFRRDRLLRELLLQQSNPAGAPAQSVFGTQRVAEHDDRDALGIFGLTMRRRSQRSLGRHRGAV